MKANGIKMRKKNKRLSCVFGYDIIIELLRPVIESREVHFFSCSREHHLYGKTDRETDRQTNILNRVVKTFRSANSKKGASRQIFLNEIFVKCHISEREKH